MKKMFLFDWNGKCLKVFGKVDRSLGEYVDLDDYFVSDDLSKTNIALDNTETVTNVKIR